MMFCATRPSTALLRNDADHRSSIKRGLFMCWRLFLLHRARFSTTLTLDARRSSVLVATIVITQQYWYKTSSLWQVQARLDGWTSSKRRGTDIVTSCVSAISRVDSEKLYEAVFPNSHANPAMHVYLEWRRFRANFFLICKNEVRSKLFYFWLLRFRLRRINISLSINFQIPIRRGRTGTYLRLTSLVYHR